MTIARSTAFYTHSLNATSSMLFLRAECKQEKTRINDGNDADVTIVVVAVAIIIIVVIDVGATTKNYLLVERTQELFHF